MGTEENYIEELVSAYKKAERNEDLIDHFQDRIHELDEQIEKLCKDKEAFKNAIVLTESRLTRVNDKYKSFHSRLIKEFNYTIEDLARIVR